MEHEHPPHGHYLIVFIALCVFTVLSVVFDILHLESKSVLAVMVIAVAVAKALCVMGFFMHLRFERNWKYVLLAPTIILAIGIPLALLPDIGVHYYTVAAPQQEDLRSAVRKIVASENASEPYTVGEIRSRLKSEYYYDVSADTVEHYLEMLNLSAAERRNTP